MNAQDLLNFLLSVQQAGVDLSTLDVVAEYSRYTRHGYENGKNHPSRVSINNTELVLGSTPCSR